MTVALHKNFNRWKKVKVKWYWFKKREERAPGSKRPKQANMDLTSSGETNQGSRLVDGW